MCTNNSNNDSSDSRTHSHACGNSSDYLTEDSKHRQNAAVTSLASAAATEHPMTANVSSHLHLSTARHPSSAFDKPMQMQMQKTTLLHRLVFGTITIAACLVASACAVRSRGGGRSNSSSGLDSANSILTWNCLPTTILSTLIGYLSIDMIYFQCYRLGISIHSSDRIKLMISEDALTLFLMIAMLCNLNGNENDDDASMPIVLYAIMAKILVKLIGCSLLAWPNKVDHQRTPTTGSQSCVFKKSVPKDQLCDESSVSSSESIIEHRPSEWYIHGIAYDLDEFVHNHPGGAEAILLGKGRDCTAMFESYHALHLHKRHWSVLEKHRVDKIVTPSRRPADLFYETLQIRVVKALQERGIDPVKDRAATWQRTGYYVIILLCWAYCGYQHVRGSILSSFFFAVFGWLMGALGHDAGHFSASRIPWINEWGVWAMCLICNPIQWQHQHTYSHHSFTNEFDRDPDLHHFHMFLRVHKRIQHHRVHRYQSNWWFVLFAYVFVVFGTCIWIPWGMLETGTLYGIVDWHDKHRWTKAVGMRMHLGLYLFVIVIAPMVISPASQLWVLFAAYLHVATLGILFAFFSQINHLTETSLDSDMDTRGHQTISWAAAQVETSNNFATSSPLWHCLSNGLNHQIEHHLFPGLNHCHLPYVAPVVRATCREFGVRYECYETWTDVAQATLKWLEKLSVDDHHARIKQE